MTANKLNILNKFKALKKTEKFFLYACITTTVGFLLPWTYMKGYGLLGIGSLATINGFEGDRGGLGVAVFLLVLILAGLIFYNKKYAVMGSFVAAGLLIIRFVLESKAWLEFFNLFGESNYSPFGAGVFVTCLGIIGMVYFAFKMYKKQKGESTKKIFIFFLLGVLILLGVGKQMKNPSGAATLGEFSENTYYQYSEEEVALLDEEKIKYFCGGFANGYCIKEIQQNQKDENGDYLGDTAREDKYQVFSIWQEQQYHLEKRPDGLMGYTDYELVCKETAPRYFICPTDLGSNGLETKVAEIRRSDVTKVLAAEIDYKAEQTKQATGLSDGEIQDIEEKYSELYNDFAPACSETFRDPTECETYVAKMAYANAISKEQENYCEIAEKSNICKIALTKSADEWRNELIAYIDAEVAKAKQN